MKPCPDRQESLWLDVYGELNPAERPAWEKHLKLCEACRSEKKRMLMTLQTIKISMLSPPLSVEKTRKLTGAVARQLQKNSKQSSWRKHLWGQSNWFVPALAATCILILAFGWVSHMEFINGLPFQTAINIDSEEQLPIEEIELISNLELLKEMESLQELIQLVDNPSEDNLSLKRIMMNRRTTRNEGLHA
jgi:predicted anti-sigma-YlaC factor YlaD